MDDAARLREYVDEIASGGGRRLPPEPKLSEALGLSRGRLRTLLKQLEDEGAIWRHVGKGTFVGPREVSAGDQAVAALLSVDDIMDARIALEPQLAAYAAMHATSADIAALDQCLADMAGAESFLLWKRLDDKLHRLIAQATHNVLLLMLFDTLRSQARDSLDTRFEEVFGSVDGPKGTTEGEHRQIVEAVRIHHPARAEQAMRAHLHAVRSGLFGLR